MILYTQLDRRYENEAINENRSSLFQTRYERRFFIALLLILFAGFVLGTFLAIHLDLFQANFQLQPFIFSGIPQFDADVFSVFSSFILNQLICLILLFLIGVTAFGVLAGPFILFIKGFFLGAGASFFICNYGIEGFAISAYIYLPFSAVSIICMLFFAMKAIQFSKQMSRIAFKTGNIEHLRFNQYVKAFSIYLVYIVLISVFGSINYFIYTLFAVT